MKLTEIYQEENESKEEFLERTYWITGNNYKNIKNKVWIYKNSQERNDPLIKPREIWNFEKAKNHMEVLHGEKEIKIEASKVEPKEIKPELVNISVEDFYTGKVTNTKWIDSINGETKHSFGE